MGVKIILDSEETKRFKACFIEDARRILAERKQAKKEAKKEANKRKEA